MNLVDHPHSVGNHQHIGTASTIAHSAVPGQKVGLIDAHQTGLLRGTVKVKEVKMTSCFVAYIYIYMPLLCIGDRMLLPTQLLCMVAL
ncbi:hypothetical protein JOM56_008128 [Amanita muscaria]